MKCRYNLPTRSLKASGSKAGAFLLTATGRGCSAEQRAVEATSNGAFFCHPKAEKNYTMISFITFDGKTVLKSTHIQGSKINISGLANEIYVIKISGLNHPIYGRFIKQ